ncbi:hypothetical protein QYF61_027679 [Mycteria americana]|uniref:Uncharacterized protein n=1 Tax=Mycteria americana TaxID=33587 RepID=A0AAN7NAG2_MYCAM|nr:hypothetical protein QYF61_027679 [Mycteria americana]
MTLQNCLALDIILLKEQGVCGMLNLSDGECCITIHNASTTIEEAWTKMKEIADQTADLFRSLQPKDRFNGHTPRSWFASLLQSWGLMGACELSTTRTTYILQGRDLRQGLEYKKAPPQGTARTHHRRIATSVIVIVVSKGVIAVTLPACGSAEQRSAFVATQTLGESKDSPISQPTEWDETPCHSRDPDSVPLYPDGTSIHCAPFTYTGFQLKGGFTIPLPHVLPLVTQEEPECAMEHENLVMYSPGTKEMQRSDEERGANQGGSVDTILYRYDFTSHSHGL